MWGSRGGRWADLCRPTFPGDTVWRCPFLGIWYVLGLFGLILSHGQVFLRILGTVLNQNGLPEWNDVKCRYIYYWVNLQIAAVERNDVKWRLYFSENPITSQYIYIGYIMDFWVIYKSRLFSPNRGYFSTNRGCGMIQYGMIFWGYLWFLLASLTIPGKTLGIPNHPLKLLGIPWKFLR